MAIVERMVEKLSVFSPEQRGRIYLAAVLSMAGVLFVPVVGGGLMAAENLIEHAPPSAARVIRLLFFIGGHLVAFGPPCSLVYLLEKRLQVSRRNTGDLTRDDGVSF